MFLLLGLLLGLTVQTALAASTSHVFGRSTVTIDTVSMGGIMNYGQTGDTCKKMIVRYRTLHHLSTEGVYQNWLKGSLATSNVLENVTTGAEVFDFDVNTMETWACFVVNQATLGMLAYKLSSSSYRINSIMQRTIPMISKQIGLFGARFWTLSAHAPSTT